MGHVSTTGATASSATSATRCSTSSCRCTTWPATRTWSCRSVIHDAAESGDQLRVFRISPPEPWRDVPRPAVGARAGQAMPRSELIGAGYWTSSSGVCVYRGGAYPGRVPRQRLRRRSRRQPGPPADADARRRDVQEPAGRREHRVRPLARQLVPPGQLRQRPRRHAARPRHVPRDDRAPLVDPRRHQGPARPHQRQGPRAASIA